MRVLRPRANDVFYDLGCGYALPCIWIAPKVKRAVGIENFAPRYHRAVSNVKKSGLDNIRIIKRSFQKVPLADATIIHCVILLGLSEYRRIGREAKGATLALCYPPMYPIKSRKTRGYYLMKVPFSSVSDENEYAGIICGRRDATIKDVHAMLNKWDSKSLRWQISHGDYIQEKLKG
jgi:hypothetical protein